MNRSYHQLLSAQAQLRNDVSALKAKVDPENPDGCGEGKDCPTTTMNQFLFKIEGSRMEATTALNRLKALVQNMLNKMPRIDLGRLEKASFAEKNA